MSRATPHIVIFFSFLFFSLGGFSQTDVSVRSAINRDKIMIGEPVELKLEAHLPAGTDASWFPLDSLAHFEFISKGKIDTVATADTRTYRQTVIITSFDSGRWAVPSLPFTIGNKEYLTDSLPVSVAYSNFDPKQDYHDIKDIIEVKPPEESKQQWWWFAAGGALLLAALLYFLLKKKKPQSSEAKKANINPYEEAMNGLEQLQRNKPVAKEYYSKLIDIFRLYVFRKKGLLSLQKTTDDLIVQLRDLDLSKDQYDKLAQSLRLGDFVKFAKYIPSADDDRNSLEEIKKSIVTIEKTETKIVSDEKSK